MAQLFNTNLKYVLNIYSIRKNSIKNPLEPHIMKLRGSFTFQVSLTVKSLIFITAVLIKL